jgi:hypothetical protein
MSIHFCDTTLGTTENQKETRYGRAKEQAAAAFWYTNHVR